MRGYKAWFIIAIVLNYFCYELKATNDNVIVDYIKTQSDLTNADVSRWKLFWLKSLAYPATVGATIFAAYQVGKLGYNFPTAYEEHITNVFKGEYMPSLVKKLEPLVKTQWIWGAVAGYKAYDVASRLLYPRIQIVMLFKINRYIDFCKALRFVQKKCDSPQEFVSTLPKRVWSAHGVIALKKGLDNLIQQADIAYSLLEQLQGKVADSEDIVGLQQKVLSFKRNIEYNEQFVTEESLQLWKKDPIFLNLD